MAKAILDEPGQDRLESGAETEPDVNAVLDFLLSIASGGARGIASVPGMLGDLQSMGQTAAVWGNRKLRGDESAEELRRSQQTQVQLPTTEDIAQATGINYDPKTTLGRYAKTGTEFVTGGAAMGPAAAVRAPLRTVATNLVPGLASEGAGQALEGTPLEGAGRVGAALLTGVPLNAATAPRTVAETVQSGVQGISPQQLDAAERLFQEAVSIGIPITRAQALQQVTGGASRLGDVQRVIEGQGGLREFFAPLPGAIQREGNEALNEIAPRPTRPSTIGPAVQEAAEGSLAHTNERINQITRPNYQRAEGHLIPPAEMAQLMNDPVYRETVRELRTNPRLMAHVEGLPDNSVAFNDLVQRRMGEALEQQDPTRSLSGLERSGVANPRQQVRQAAMDASAGEYEAALAEQTRLRGRYLEPLQQGPLGQLAKDNTTTQSAITTLFPQGRQVSSPEEVRRAVSGVAAQGPAGTTAARQLVRQYLGMTFDELTQGLQGGPNQFGGAGFAAAVRGNPGQRANLEAAISALPNGAQLREGFNRFLTIMEATGQRQRIGSNTSFNNELLAELKQGGATDEIIKTLTGTPLSYPSKVRDRLERWRMGNNVRELGDLLTDPRAAARFRRLAELPVGGAAFMRTLGGIAALGVRASTPDEE